MLYALYTHIKTDFRHDWETSDDESVLGTTPNRQEIAKQKLQMFEDNKRDQMERKEKMKKKKKIQGLDYFQIPSV